MSTTQTVCHICHSRLEPDGVCLACLLTEALSAPDLDIPGSSTLDGVRSYATLGRLELPCLLAGHRLLREIASGGMGIVYEAEHPRLQRRVALKMLRSAAFARTEELTRFRVEAELAAQLEHPHIVPIYEVGDVDGMPFFTMRLIEGASLAEKLQNADGAMSARDAAALMVKLARAVQHAHERGMLHRDLKPANILLDERGEPHLTDFGLAKLLDDVSMLTRTTAQLGTPHYMSPEQAAGRVRQITTASDVWALGVLLHQLLTLRLPFTGESSAEIMRQVTDASPVALDLRGLNADLATLVQRCLEKEPSKRPPSAGFLADELERWQNGRTILSRPVDAWERGFRWVRRNKALAAAVVLTASGLLVGSAVALWQRQQAVAARDQARRELKDAEAVTGLMVEMLKVFDDQHGGPVTTKDEIVTEFLKQVEAFEGDPRRQIALITSTGTLLEQEDNSRCYQRAVEIAQRTLPPDDPQIWYLRWRAASTKPGSYNRDGRLIPELRTVYEWHRDHLGLDDPQTIRAMESLARRLVVTGGEVEALGLLEKVRAVMEQRPEDPPVSRVKFDNIYMQALFRNGRHEEALSFGRTNCRRAVHEINPEVSHETARFCHMLAKVCHESGQTAEAVGHMRQALDICWQYEGPATEGALEALNYLLSLHHALRDDTALLSTQRDALRAFDMALGPSRPETQRQVAAYAQTLVTTGRVAEADALFTQWLDRLRGGDGTLALQAAELERLRAEHLQATGR